MPGNTRVLIFAKAPIPGETKTRLLPTLTAEEAAELQQWLTVCAVQRWHKLPSCTAELWIAGQTDHPLFVQLQRSTGVIVRRQIGPDLGIRMHNAVTETLTSAGMVIVIGTDCVTLEPEIVEQAKHALYTSDVFLVPADDGGYVLIATKRPIPALFENIPWGTSVVADATRRRARDTGLRLAEGANTWDIDRPNDLQRLADYVWRHGLQDQAPVWLRNFTCGDGGPRPAP